MNTKEKILQDALEELKQKAGDGTVNIDEYEKLIHEKLLALIAEISQDNEEYY